METQSLIENSSFRQHQVESMQERKSIEQTQLLARFDN